LICGSGYYSLVVAYFRDNLENQPTDAKGISRRWICLLKALRNHVRLISKSARNVKAAVPGFPSS
jgi:hypothetical protein